MTGATFIALINLVVAGLVAASFLAISTHDSVRVAGRWLSGAYALGMLYYVIEFSIRLVSDSAFMMALSAAVLLSGLTAPISASRPVTRSEPSFSSQFSQ
ncbi:MAG: hypothetical protein R3D70_17955 [Rhizobiaceae bacterium]